MSSFRVGPLLRSVPIPLALIAMIGLAGAVLGRVYAGPLLTQLVLGAAVGSVGVSVAARRLPSWLVAPLSVLALAGYAAFALRLAAQRADLPGGLADLVAEAGRNGIPRLLTAMIPVEPVPDTVIVPLVAAWLAGLAGAEVAVRAGRVLLGYLPPALLYAGALYVVGPNAEPAIWWTVAFAAAAATGLAVPAATSTSTPAETGATLPPAVRAAIRVRVLAGTAAGLVVVVALAALLAPLVAGQVGNAPVDPRRYVQPPQVDALDENPLIRISGWALDPDQKLLDLHTTGTAAPAGDDRPPAGDGDTPPDDADPGAGERVGDSPTEQTPRSVGVRIRLAVLNDYDGVTWRVGATYRNAGRILPAVEPPDGVTVDRVRQEITVGELAGRLLPAVPTPREVTGARVAYDPGSGTLIRPEGLTEGLRYTVTSARERPDPNLLTAANVPAGDAVARVLRVADGVPDPLRRLADQLAADNGAPYARAMAIEEWLAEHYRLVADAPSGHAYPNLNFFLFGPRNGGGQRGTSEQFAATFAVLGRLMGLPTRVVVGFHSATGEGPVRGGDAYAWPEVLFDGLGWVSFDPLPRPETEPRPVEEDFTPKPQDPPPVQDEPTPEPSAPPTVAAAPGNGPASGSGSPVPVLAGAGSGGLLLVLTGFVVAILTMRRGLRRRRLDEGTPAQRIAGAWREVTDALRLAGHPVASHLDASEVAAYAAQVAGTAAAEPVTVPTPAAPGAAAPTPAGSSPRSRPRPSPRPRPAPEHSPDRPPAPGPVTTVPPIDELATLVNVATFAPGTASDEQARRAGTLAVAYATALRAVRPWWRRALWSVHPGPLRWRR
ncbi:transglutaminaseTgpA domain-containing protein [Micromonospora pisi]|uniref:transglutaminaseTgpA domain-containing protein n=1 Tax=Micromonospora pisi TaxID=589240 RepID=UPI001FE755BF|nr:transglutaminaseTgpA domain-containing protein [Micromonospora pisi]